LHYLSPSAPLLGDTTATSALIFSPLLASHPHDQPTYPNYTLPPAILNLPMYTGTPSNLTTPVPPLTLVIIPTSSSPTNDGLDSSLCAVKAGDDDADNVGSTQLVNGTAQWMSVGREEGFRNTDGHGGMSAPIWFATKDGMW
jgi:calcium channel MID1